MKPYGKDTLFVAPPASRVKARIYMWRGSLAFINAAFLFLIWPSLTMAARLWFVVVTLLLVLTAVPYVLPQVVFSRETIRGRGMFGRVSTFRYHDIQQIKNSWFFGLIIVFRNGRRFHIPPWWQADTEKILGLIRGIDPACQVDGDGSYQDPNKLISLGL